MLWFIDRIVRGKMRRLIKREDNVFFENEEGERIGPYKTRFNTDTIIIYDAELDVKSMSYAIQLLPDGNENKFSIISIKFSTGRKLIEPYFTVSLSNSL